MQQQQAQPQQPQQPPGAHLLQPQGKGQPLVGARPPAGFLKPVQPIGLAKPVQPGSKIVIPANANANGGAGVAAGIAKIPTQGSMVSKTTTLWVQGLPGAVGEEHIRRFFAREQLEVDKVTICLDAKSGKCKGYAFADFADHDTAAHAVSTLSGVEVAGNTITLQIKDPFALKTRAVTPLAGK